MKKAKKNLGGRPKKPADQVKSANLARIRVTQAEIVALHDAAAKAGQKFTAYVRSRLGL